MADCRIKTNTQSKFVAKLTMREGERLRTTNNTGAWTYGIIGVVMSNVVNDQAVVMFSSCHRQAPHGEAPAPTSPFPRVSVEIDADDYAEGTHTLKDVSVNRHGNHYDIYRMVVKFTVSSFWFADSITSLEADISAEHRAKLPRGLKVTKDRKVGPQIEKHSKAIKEKYVEWRKSQRSSADK